MKFLPKKLLTSLITFWGEYYAIKLDVNIEVEVKELTDLPKLKLFMESLQMKINKSQLARDLNVDRRTVEKYLNGYQPVTTRKRK
ncbi:hypothetical protein [Pueribacillus sp. YX66]|uniref:hypothetical protein n=1 Tax=Pueribacillus sp. YX66 TaxID=3229242 RepID=UPI00358CFCF4